MNDVYAINKAKSEYREGFNTGDAERVLSVFADAFIDMTHAEPGFYGPEAKESLRLRLQELFAEYEAKMVPIVSDIGVFGDFAFDWGWYELTLTRRATGEKGTHYGRYCETWARHPDGSWKITYYISNENLPSVMLEERYGRQLAGSGAAAD